MSDFPPSLLEILLKPNVTDEVVVREVAKETSTNLADVFAPALGILSKMRDDYKTDKEDLQRTQKYTERQARQWLGVIGGPKIKKEVSELVAFLGAHIDGIDREIANIYEKIKMLEKEGVFVPDYHYLPASLIAPHQRLYLSQVNFYPPGQVDFFPTGILKVKQAHVVSLSRLLGNLATYEGELVITEGFVIGQGHDINYYSSAEFSEGSHYYSFILRDTQTGHLLQANGNSVGYLNRPAKTILISQADSRQPTIQAANISDISAYLDASKTLESPVVIGGTIYIGRFNADMFATKIGNQRQVFAHVIDIKGKQY